MLELLNALLDKIGEKRATEIISMKSEYTLMSQSVQQKYCRLDVVIVDNFGRIFDIEAQNDKDTMNERLLFYGARAISDATDSGTQYDEIPTVRAFGLLNFRIRKRDQNLIVSSSLRYDDTLNVSTNQLRIACVQLPVFRKKYKTLESVKGDPLLEWLYLLDQAYKSRKEMEKMAKMTIGMRNFVERYYWAISSSTFVRRMRMYKDGERNVRSCIAYARKESAEEAELKAELKTAQQVAKVKEDAKAETAQQVAKVKEEAEAETAQQVAKVKEEAEQKAAETNRLHAKGMKDAGMDLQTIANVTGLSLDEIEEL